MDEDLEAFAVFADAGTITPGVTFEGTNATRFALVAALDGNQPEAVAPALDEVTVEVAEQFGLNPELIIRAAELNSAEQEYVQAAALIERYGDSWSPSEVRYGAWSALNQEGDLSSRLALLVAGMCSPLERESVTAAVAIVNSVSSAQTATPSRFWRRWPLWFDEPLIDPLLAGGPWPWLTTLPDEDDDPESVQEWPGGYWEAYSSRWVSTATLSADPSDLLSAIRVLARQRIDLARRSGDPITRQLAAAAFLYRPGDSGSFVPTSTTLLDSRRDATSTMVHGTWGWKGNWWYPGGDFHKFIRDGHRSRLYDAGQEFSWSGAYKKKHRAIGGERFKRWADAVGGTDGLGTVFAHSYGAEVVARAVNNGAVIDEAVFLSAPIHDHHLYMLDRVRNVVDVRLKNDIVLRLARARQKLPDRDNLRTHIIDRSLWSHGASHHPDVWQSENIAKLVRL